MPVNRRTFIKRTLLASGAVAGGRLLRPYNLLATPDTANPLRHIPDLEGNLMTVAPARFPLSPPNESAIYGINGSYLGPTVRLNRGEEFRVKMENRLPDQDLIIHWHGILAPSEMDGHPHLAVGSGSDFDYQFTINQRAGTYWYHSHTDKLTGPQVYKGVAGLFIVHDEEERGLGLPEGEYDIPLVLQDKRVTPDFELEYDLNQTEIMRGWQGDTILVNGRPDTRIDVAPTLYRFRLLNGSNARVFLVGFENGHSFHLIANDGGLLEAPIEIDKFFLPPAGRAEILVDFSEFEVGATLLLRSLLYFNESFPGSRQGQEVDLLCFRVTQGEGSGGVIPQTMSTIEPYSLDDAVVTRKFQMHHKSGVGHTINDLAFELHRIDFEVPMEQLEVWEFFNPTQLIHPMHVHGTQFQILDRNGRKENVRPEEQGWKDMALVFPQEQVRVLVRFDAHPGMFMLHCHNLEHEDDGMMMNFKVNTSTSVKEQGGGISFHASPNPVQGETLIRFRSVKGDRQLRVLDLQGRVLSRHTVPSGRDSYLLDMSGFASGSYWCSLGNESIRLIVR